jgi:LysR family glycine cleavage system transcriptional activator
MRRAIPSINALITFDAAARHQSFTRAAEELALTESAVSRQVAGLEADLGIRLFERVKKRVALTRAGRAYSEQVKQALERIERDTLEIMAHEGKGGILELAVLPTFASQWLIPRLPAFGARHPDVTINLSVRTRVFLFDDTPFDAAIHFGLPTWPGAEAHYLFTDEAVPVCAPALLKKGRAVQPRTLAALPLLHSATRPEDWRNWFAAAGIEGINAMKGPRYELHSMLISAACLGMGVALLPGFLVERQVRSGELVIPLEQPLQTGKAYYLVCPESAQSAKPLSDFRAWLVAEAEQFRAERGGNPI